MCGFDDQMFRIIDVLLLASGVGTPEDEYDRFFFFVQFLDDRIRQSLPASSFMGICLVSFNGQHGVEEQYSLFCPVSKETVIGDEAAKIIMEFLVDILQGRRYLYRL